MDREGDETITCFFLAQSQEVAKAYTAACTPDFYVFKKVRIGLGIGMRWRVRLFLVTMMMTGVIINGRDVKGG